MYGLDPARNSEFTSSVFVMDRIYSPVYRSEGDPSNLADSVTSDSFGEIWTIYLKKGLHFQDDPCFPDGRGAEVTAEDVAFSWRRAKAPPFLVHPVVKQIKKMEVLDRYTLRVTANEPNLKFPDELAREEFLIVSQKAVEYYGDDFRHHPVGSGPFRLAELNPGEIILVRNENFWVEDEFGQKIPYLDKIIFEFDPDPVSRYRKLLSGAFDVISLGEINSPSIVEFNERDLTFSLLDTLKKKGIKLVDGKILSLLHCPINRPLKTSPQVRQALNWAIDRNRIQGKGLCTNGIPARGPLFRPVSPQAERFGYDPERAKRLLAQAGFPGGEGFPTLVFSVSPTSMPLYREVENDLNEMGIKTDFVTQSHLESFSRHQRKWTTILVSYTTWEDPLEQLMPYQGRYYLSLGGQGEYTKFDSLYRLAEREPSEQNRMQYIRQMEEIILSKPPAIFLFWIKLFYLTRDNVVNLDPKRFGVYERTWIRKQGHEKS